jgi:hypothetical protein
MQRRQLITLGVAALPSLACARLGQDQAWPLEPERPALQLRQFQAATGPLDRFTSRQGAWYALLWLPMPVQWPVEVVLAAPARRHNLRLTALDRAPDDAPQVAIDLPLAPGTERSGHHGATGWHSRFMLPANSQANALFLLLELWHPEGLQPAPLWVERREGVRLHPQQALGQRPPDRPATAGGAAVPPESPLTQALQDRPVLELTGLGVPRNLPALPGSNP